MSNERHITHIHPYLGELTDEEYRYMRQLPIGMDRETQWSQERLNAVRDVISRNRKQATARRHTEPNLPDGITYGGVGPKGEYYEKDTDVMSSHVLWTEGEESWNASELRAIARHQDWLKGE